MARNNRNRARQIFPFEKLPAELRIQIYQYLFLSGNPLHIITAKVLSCPRVETAKAITYPHRQGDKLGKPAKFLSVWDTSFISTCKGIRDETLPVLYAQNRFIFTYQQDLRLFAQWPKSGVPLIQHITFDIAADAVEHKLTPTIYLHAFTGLRTFQWTLKGLRTYRDYPGRKALELLEPAEDFISFGNGVAARRAQFEKIRFVTRTKLAPPKPGKPGYQTVDEVLKAIKEELGGLLSEFI